MSINSVLTPTITAVIPAAGIGSRMQAEIPKQYLKINNKTIIEYSIEVLLRHPLITQVIVVINPNDTLFHALPIAADPRVIVTQGGQLRADSVMAGLMQVKESDWVLVHDAARPCLSDSDLDKLINILLHSTVGGILAAPASDTMKRAVINENCISHTVDRNNLWHAMTPQMFPLELLKTCLARALSDSAIITDESSALEYCGFAPLLVAGRTDNIKVTRPEDLVLAQFYLQQESL